jgi:hypothetical protein
VAEAVEGGGDVVAGGGVGLGRVVGGVEELEVADEVEGEAAEAPIVRTGWVRGGESLNEGGR